MTEQQLLSVVRRLLQPIVRFCLRSNVKLQDLTECAKSVYLQVAAEEIEARGNKVSLSRLSVMSGVHRRDVMRLYRDEEEPKPSTNLIGKVLGQWLQDRRFCDSPGKPKVLSCAGVGNQFARLVESVSKDLNSYTVLFELERIGAVERTKKGLRLLHSSYVPKGNLLAGIEMMSRDVSDLMQAVQENLESETPRNLHLQTEFDRIPVEAEPEIRKWVLREGAAFHARVREFLARFDLDFRASKSDREPTARVAIGTFSVLERRKDQ